MGSEVEAGRGWDERTLLLVRCLLASITCGAFWLFLLFAAVLFFIAGMHRVPAQMSILMKLGPLASRERATARG